MVRTSGRDLKNDFLKVKVEAGWKTAPSADLVGKYAALIKAYIMAGCSNGILPSKKLEMAPPHVNYYY